MPKTERQRLDEKIDRQIEETFPASDPPAVTSPGATGAEDPATPPRATPPAGPAAKRRS